MEGIGLTKPIPSVIISVHFEHTQKGGFMKLLATLVMSLVLVGCSTSAGLVKGLGEDIKASTDWTASKIKSN